MVYVGLIMFVAVIVFLIAWTAVLAYSLHEEQRRLSGYHKHQRELLRRRLITEEEFEGSMREYERVASAIRKDYKELRKTLLCGTIVGIVCLGIFIMFSVICKV